MVMVMMTINEDKNDDIITGSDNDEISVYDVIY